MGRSSRELLLVLWGAVTLRGAFILKEIWALDKICIMLGASFGVNMKVTLFCNLNVTIVCISLQKYVTH